MAVLCGPSGATSVWVVNLALPVLIRCDLPLPNSSCDISLTPAGDSSVTHRIVLNHLLFPWEWRKLHTGYRYTLIYVPLTLSLALSVRETTELVIFSLSHDVSFPSFHFKDFWRSLHNDAVIRFKDLSVYLVGFSFLSNTLLSACIKHSFVNTLIMVTTLKNKFF